MSALQSLNDELAAVVAQAQRSLVQVRDGRRGAGAGTIWHANGLILTNAHVVSRSRLDVVLPDGRTLPARLLAADRAHDLAALSIAATDLRPMPLGDSRQLRAGQWVFALGHPWGVTNAVTAGIVIGEASERPAGTDADDWLAVSLHLRPGYSGGALVDESGRLVGINTLMTGPDVGVAIPVHVAKRFLQEALAQQN
jgi:serine protease Do